MHCLQFHRVGVVALILASLQMVAVGKHELREGLGKVGHKIHATDLKIHQIMDLGDLSQSKLLKTFDSGGNGHHHHHATHAARETHHASPDVNSAKSTETLPVTLNVVVNVGDDLLDSVRANKSLHPHNDASAHQNLTNNPKIPEMKERKGASVVKRDVRMDEPPSVSLESSEEAQVGVAVLNDRSHLKFPYQSPDGTIAVAPFKTIKLMSAPYIGNSSHKDLKPKNPPSANLKDWADTLVAGIFHTSIENHPNAKVNFHVLTVPATSDSPRSLGILNSTTYLHTRSPSPPVPALLFRNMTRRPKEFKHTSKRLQKISGTKEHNPNFKVFPIFRQETTATSFSKPGYSGATSKNSNTTLTNWKNSELSKVENITTSGNLIDFGGHPTTTPATADVVLPVPSSTIRLPSLPTHSNLRNSTKFTPDRNPHLVKKSKKLTQEENNLIAAAAAFWHKIMLSTTASPHTILRETSRLFRTTPQSLSSIGDELPRILKIMSQSSEGDTEVVTDLAPLETQHHGVHSEMKPSLNHLIKYSALNIQASMPTTLRSIPKNSFELDQAKDSSLYMEKYISDRVATPAETIKRVFKVNLTELERTIEKPPLSRHGGRNKTRHHNGTPRYPNKHGFDDRLPDFVVPQLKKLRKTIRRHPKHFHNPVHLFPNPTISKNKSCDSPPYCEQITISKKYVVQIINNTSNGTSSQRASYKKSKEILRANTEVELVRKHSETGVTTGTDSFSSFETSSMVPLESELVELYNRSTPPELFEPAWSSTAVPPESTHPSHIRSGQTTRSNEDEDRHVRGPEMLAWSTSAPERSTVLEDYWSTIAPEWSTAVTEETPEYPFAVNVKEHGDAQVHHDATLKTSTLRALGDDINRIASPNYIPTSHHSKVYSNRVEDTAKFRITMLAHPMSQPKPDLVGKVYNDSFVRAQEVGRNSSTNVAIKRITTLRLFQQGVLPPNETLIPGQTTQVQDKIRIRGHQRANISSPLTTNSRPNNALKINSNPIVSMSVTPLDHRPHTGVVHEQPKSSTMNSITKISSDSTESHSHDEGSNELNFDDLVHILLAALEHKGPLSTKFRRKNRKFVNRKILPPLNQISIPGSSNVSKRLKKPHRKIRVQVKPGGEIKGKLKLGSTRISSFETNKLSEILLGALARELQNDSHRIPQADPLNQHEMSPMSHERKTERVPKSISVHEGPSLLAGENSGFKTVANALKTFIKAMKIKPRINESAPRHPTPKIPPVSSIIQITSPMSKITASTPVTQNPGFLMRLNTEDGVSMELHANSTFVLVDDLKKIMKILNPITFSGRDSNSVITKASTENLPDIANSSISSQTVTTSAPFIKKFTQSFPGKSAEKTPLIVPNQIHPPTFLLPASFTPTSSFEMKDSSRHDQFNGATNTKGNSSPLMRAFAKSVQKLELQESMAVKPSSPEPGKQQKNFGSPLFRYTVSPPDNSLLLPVIEMALKQAEESPKAYNPSVFQYFGRGWVPPGEHHHHHKSQTTRPSADFRPKAKEANALREIGIQRDRNFIDGDNIEGIKIASPHETPPKQKLVTKEVTIQGVNANARLLLEEMIPDTLNSPAGDSVGKNLSEASAPPRKKGIISGRGVIGIGRTASADGGHNSDSPTVGKSEPDTSKTKFTLHDVLEAALKKGIIRP